MSLTILRVSLLAALCCAVMPAASARARRNIKPNSPGAARSAAARRQETAGGGAASRAPAQGDEERAEELYKRGLEFSERGDKRVALDTLGAALKLYVKLYVSHAPPVASPASDSFALYRAETAARLAHAPECVEAYLRLGGGTDFERSQLEAFRGQVLMLRESEPSRTVLSMQEVDRRAIITFKQEPGFTEEARRNKVKGTVRLRAVLAADGTVKYVFVLSGLPHGLSEKSVEAALKTRFTPALKDGQPVSQLVMLEYHFYIY